MQLMQLMIMIMNMQLMISDIIECTCEFVNIDAYSIVKNGTFFLESYSLDVWETNAAQY